MVKTRELRPCACGHDRHWHTIRRTCVGNREAAGGPGGADCACPGFEAAEQEGAR